MHEVADLIARWQFDEARDALTEMVTRTRIEEPDGLSARRMLAEVLRELGETDAAYPLAVRVTRAAQARLGPAHPETVRARIVLATLLHERGRLAEAEQEYLAAVHSGATVDGPAGRALLLGRANLALLRRDLGEPERAAEELSGVYRTWRVRYGADDLDSARLAAELGRLWLDLGHRSQARRLLAVAYVAAGAALGEEHPQTVRTAQVLAEAEAPLGEGRPADELPRQHRYRPRRRVGLVVGVLGALLAMAGALLTVAEHRSAPAASRPSAPDTGTSAGPVLGPRPPPGNVALHDEGTSLTVTWTDPSAGVGTVLLALSSGGQQAGHLRPLPAGTQRYQLNGLNPAVEYCVIVALVYPGDTVARAVRVCTHRHG